MNEQINKKDETLKTRSSPKDVFLHLLMVAMLYTSTISFIFLWFSYIDYLFPDKLNFYYRAVLEGVLSSTAILFVAFPIFLLVSWLISRDEKKDPVKHELRVRQWLIYLTLFVSAIAMIVAVINLVHDFLFGELTLPFFFKIFVVLLVAGGAFGYYLWDVKRTADNPSKAPRMLAWISSSVVVVSIALGFVLVGSPATQRAMRFDEQRISDLQNIQSQVLNYWQQKEVLPAKLSDMSDNISGFVPPLDPDSRISYEYSVKSQLSFELCATFGAKSVENSSPDRSYPIELKGSEMTDSWSHEEGKQCFERTIDPAIYKINKPMPVIIQDKTAPAAVPVQ